MKKHIFTNEEKKFLNNVNTILKDTEHGPHMVNELCIFLAGFSHGLNLQLEYRNEDRLIIDSLKKFLTPRYDTGIIGSNFWLIQKNSYSRKLFYRYMKVADSISEESVLTYGLLMGYPKTACIAFTKDNNRSITKRMFALNFGSSFILDKVYPNLGLINCVYSKKHWQAEYKEIFWKELHIVEQLPKLFPKHHSKKSKKYISELIEKIKAKNIFSKIPLDIKAKFLACESGKLNQKEHLELFKSIPEIKI